MNGNKVGIADPKLGDLADNDGPTLTHEVLSGSAAINSGDPDDEDLREFDQRGGGFPRIVGDRVDIGAFESAFVDTTPPAAPAVGSPTAATSVNANSFNITGTTEADSFVQVYRDVNNNGVIDAGDTVVGSQQLSGGANSYSISVTLTQNAANNFLVTSTDGSNNESAPGDVPTITADSVTPTAAIVAVSPNPRLTAVTDPIAINFGESVTGLDITDFTLTRNGDPVTLTAAMLTGGGSAYNLNLSTVTGLEGTYVLTLKSTGTGIPPLAGGRPCPIPARFPTTT
ncbi:MAG: FHA domain-containing protein [Planctomycetota bacterium]|nr:MAG: FHA domain-containing protein [Planctomycetota bacterium]